MEKHIYISGLISFIIQLITIIIDTYALNLPINPKLYGIKVLLWIEYIVNFIEFIFYSWMLNNFSIINNITKYRYYDWVITTPVMLFTYSMYLLIIRKIEENKQYNLFNLIDNEKYKLITIILLNWTMLFFGYISELGMMNAKISTFLGFIPFIIMFYIIYENYAKYSSLGINTFIYFVSVWGLYGIAALMNYNIKNIMYNILDLFAKNFFALFLAYVLIYKYAYNN